MMCQDDEKMKEIVEHIKAHCEEKMKKAEETITEHPIPSVLIAAGAGILIGVLIGKMYCNRE
jgi:ElaB/YqjD/DUF883 family membrane-anchored ribosome-binding protein